MIIFAATAMNNYYKGKAKYILASTTMLLLIAITSISRERSVSDFQFDKNLTVADSIPVPSKISPAEKKMPLRNFSKPKVNRTDSIPIIDSPIDSMFAERTKILLEVY